MINKTIPLRIFILKCLDGNEYNGYGLMAHINDEFGWKPSPGSIYPMLKSMQKEGLIEFRKEGSKKTYHITHKGKAAYTEIKKHHAEIAENIQRHLRAMSSIMGVKDEFLKNVLHNVKNAEAPFKELNPEFMRVRAVLLETYKKGKIKEIKEILSETERKLRRV